MLNICNIFANKSIKIFFLSTLFVSNLLSSSFIEQIEQNTLHNDPYWSKLLHYRGDKSEVVSDNFFVSKTGRYDKKEELFETIDALTNGKDNVFCRFPLRVKWLSEKIEGLSEKVVKYECKELEEYKKNTLAKKVSVVFPSSHINSPASMYGHTFIKIDDKNGAELLSNALNYAAQTDESNGLIFAYKGLFGGYEGRFSILPYYEKIKEYNNLENRDIWEYELNLNEEEIEKIVLHAYELNGSYSPYYFALENCSYNLLWLLEVAKPEFDYVEKFSLSAVPLDTVKLLNSYGLIEKSNYRYSKMKKIKTLINNVEDKSYIKSFVKDDDELGFDSLGKEDKAYYLDLKIEYLLYERSKNKISKEEYLKKYLELLKQRSKIDVVSDFSIKSPKNPLFAHDSSKIEFSYMSDNKMLLSLKPVYSDIYDVLDGHLEGAFIDFFKIDGIIDKNKLTLDKMTFLNIESYSPLNILFNPISWGIEVSYENRELYDKYLKISPKAGFTISNGNEYAFFMLKANLYQNLKDSLASIGPNIGVISNRFEDFKFGAIYNRDFYTNKNIDEKLELFTSYKINDKLSLKLDYSSYKNRNDIFSLGMFYYF